MSTSADAPRTLLSLAGVEPRQARLSQAVLVIIDAQNEYRSGALPLAGVDPAVRRLALLLKRARAAGAPVIHVAQLGRPGGLFDPEGDGGAFMAEVAPAEGERVIRKRLPNAFHETDLKAIVDAHERPQLLLAGFMTHMCVSTTARAALDLGLTGVFVAADATATRALPDPAGPGVIAAADVQRVALAGIADRFAEVVHSDSISA